MSNQEFIKKGVVENETQEQPIKTASDEIFEKIKHNYKYYANNYFYEEC